MKWISVFLAVVFAACSGGSSGTDAGPGSQDGGPNAVDAGPGGPCDDVDCGTGAQCEVFENQAYCACLEGSCGGGAECLTEQGLSLCACPDGSIYVGGQCPAAGSCPAGMSFIDGETCIDNLEFTIDDYLGFLNSLGSACDDPGPTCTACGGRRCFPSDASNPWHYDEDDGGWWIEGDVGQSLEHPARFLTFDAAKAACQSVGKRLCTGDEWQFACGGVSGRAYPYGDTYQPGRCNESTGTFGFYPWATGSEPDCTTIGHPELRDQSGNVWEWVEDCVGDTCFVRGGSYNVNGSFFPDAFGCEFEQGHERESAEFDIGFRCCADPL